MFGLVGFCEPLMEYVLILWSILGWFLPRARVRAVEEKEDDCCHWELRRVVSGPEPTMRRVTFAFRGIWNTWAREVKMEECGMVVSIVFFTSSEIFLKMDDLEQVRFTYLTNVFPFRGTVLCFLSALC